MRQAVPFSKAGRINRRRRFASVRIFFLLASLTGASSFACAGPQATVTLLDGSSQSGEVQQLSVDGIELMTDQGEQKIPGNTVLQLEFSAVEEGEPAASSITARFVDRTLLNLASLESDGTRVKIVTPDLPALEVPVRQVADVRLAALDDKVAAAWEDLRTRNARDDLLVFRKGDVLDYVAGSIGKVTDKAVVILVRGKELSAPRERIFGMIFASREVAAQDHPVAVETQAGDLIQAGALLLKGELLAVTSASLGEVSLPLSSLRSLDYGGGRIRFLASLPFDDSASKSPNEEHPVVWFVCRNAPSGTGGRAALTIGDQEYRRGLWLHSGAELRFRLNREFTRMRTTAGFELTHVTRMPRFDPHVRLVIQGDGKDLYRKDFRWNDPPEHLDISLKDVRELTIRVESTGSRQGILEHFALGDAQVIQ